MKKLVVKYPSANTGQIIAKILCAHKVKHIFCLIGGHVSPILVEAEKQNIQIIDTRHEATAVFAADAYGRLSGNIGVACVTAGPGLSNTITPLKNAQMAQSPLLLISGAAPLLLQGRGALQDIDQISLIKSIVKFYYKIKSIRDIPKVMKKAIYIAKNETPGPVYLEFPELQAQMGLITRTTKQQVQKDESLINQILIPQDKENMNLNQKEYLNKLDKNSPIFLKVGKKINIFQKLYFKYKLKEMFGNAWNDFDSTPLSAYKYNNNQVKEQISKICKLLSQAKKPIFLLGSQFMVDPTISFQLKECIEKLMIPTYCGGMSRGISPCCYRHNRSQALKEADLIILFGVVVDFRLGNITNLLKALICKGYGRNLNRKAKIISINRNKQDLALNSDIFWKAFLKIQFDPGQFLLQLSSQFFKSNCNLKFEVNQWKQQLDEFQKSKIQKMDQDAKGISKGHGKFQNQQLINPLKLFQIVNEIYSSIKVDNSPIFIGDGGDFVATAAYSLNLQRPLSWLDPGAFGTLGCGAGFALAAKILFPAREVIIIWGDGSAGYGIMEYDTFVKFNLNIKSIIGNDACWTQILRDQIHILGKDTACYLQYLDYDNIVKAIGGSGEQLYYQFQQNANRTVFETDALKNQLQKLKESKAPYALNVLIGDSSFREGSISI